MLGCLLIAVLLILVVLAPFIGIPLLLLTLAVMVVLAVTGALGKVLGALLARPGSRAGGRSQSRVYACSECEGVFGSRDSLMAHLARDHPRP